MRTAIIGLRRGLHQITTCTRNTAAVAPAMRKADLTVADQAVTRAGFKSGNFPQAARRGGISCELICPKQPILPA
jgi:hypothetical protein